MVALVGATLLAGVVAAAPPRFDDPGEARSANGAILLRWDTEIAIGEREYELQEADEQTFEQAKLRYRGSFPSFFVSGRHDGTRYFRVRSRSRANGPESAWTGWSQTKIVIVEHHDLGVALGLFGAGAIVFIATCLALVAGSRTNSEPSE